jgi:hypothetical protein
MTGGNLEKPVFAALINPASILGQAPRFIEGRFFEIPGIYHRQNL